jgi:hypothetical protein
MCMSSHKSGLARLVSALVAISLVLAGVVGSYAHAHAHGMGSVHSDCSQHHGIPGAIDDHSPTQVVDDGTNAPSGHATSCDFACHGGVAILSLGVSIQRQLEPAVEPDASRNLDLLLFASLDRPPRSPVTA